MQPEWRNHAGNSNLRLLSRIISIRNRAKQTATNEHKTSWSSINSLNNGNLDQGEVDLVIDELERIEEFILDGSRSDSATVAGSPTLVHSESSFGQTQVLIQRILFDVSCRGELVAPYIQLEEFLPLAPRSYSADRKIQITWQDSESTEQVKQARMIFEELLRQGVDRRSAITMMGPLGSKVSRYKASLSFKEGERYDPRFGLTRDGNPFML